MEKMFFGNENVFFKPVTPIELKKLIKCLDTNKAAGVNAIPSELIKIAAKSRKIALVAPIDKEKLNKNKISNFKSVGVLNTVSKLYEKIMKNS